MEAERDDKIDAAKGIDTTKDTTNAIPENTPPHPRLFSSERFIFSTTTGDANIGCIDKVGNMFAEFKRKPPTLKGALESMGYGGKSEELHTTFTNKAREKLIDIDAPGLSTEDVAAIFCYTYEWEEEKFGEDIDSPYRKLNESISVERRNPVLKKTRAFLFLLLQALRKLPRYTPANRTLYRGLRTHVQTEVNPEHPDRKPYAAGNDKTWWAFSSTTEDLDITRRFVEENEGTLFTLCGKVWGYGISIFSDFPDEKEVLLEPERKLLIKSVSKEGTIIAVDAEILDTALVLKDHINVSVVKIKERISKIKDAPRNLRIEEITENTVALSWDVPETSGGKVLSYQVSVRQTSEAFFNRSSESSYIVKKGETKYTVKDLEEGKEYEFRVRCKYSDGWGQAWSEKIVVRVRWDCAWEKCPDDADKSTKYTLNEKNPRIATKITSDNSWCTIIGNTHIPLNKVKSWNIKIHKSINNGSGIYIGVAPSDINQNKINYNKCGWYFYCYYSKLFSGPPHNYRCKEYWPIKEKGQYVHTGDSVGVVMDTTKGDLSFVLNNVNLGIAYERIPLDKPLVPCVLLENEGDSVELDTSKVKETEVDSSIPALSNITVKSVTWDSITLTWNKVADASFYQIEVDGNKSWDASATNSFTKGGLFPDTEHSFRVRTVRGSSVSGWSNPVKGRTLKESFETSGWKECPDDVYKSMKYALNEKNSRIATKTDNGCCTIIGSTCVPLNTVTSWSIKVLGSKYNGGNGIYIGVAPSDIDQRVHYNYAKCGWYFSCYTSTLYSGHLNYKRKEYGPRKEKGQYVHTGDSVGVMVDTAKGELSFVLNEVNLGVACKGIPLDKPLVPCVILNHEGDSVELDHSEIKEEVDSSIPVPSNIITKNGVTWDLITLTWDKVSDASFYQIEVDGSISWDAITTNTFTKRGFLPEIEHNFRVRTVRGSSVSEWSSVVKGRTLKESFETSEWKECPDDNKKYDSDGKDPRIATKINSDYDYCTIIGNTHIPLNKATSWSIKILKSRNNDGYNIFIGIAPSGIDQNDLNHKKCGWYFDCYCSKLYSGSPHNFNGKEYGPRKDGGEYVHTWDSVGVVMDTTRGELSFVLNGVNLGIAYERIPLDKPLVPCVLLGWHEDSVELNTSGVKENVDSSVPIPSNITAKSITWNSITLTWNKVRDVSFYQVEVNGSKSWDATTANTFIKRGLLPETEHNFRVRTVRGSLVSEWSDVVKGRTLKESFETSGWKECPDDINDNKKYDSDGRDPRVATKINSDYDDCTIIGNTPILPSKVISWGVKIRKSKDNDGYYIYIGIAPFDINQNEVNHDKCGWYFGCYWSTLRSGPPHNYRGKGYGPRKKTGEYVHTGDSVGVVVDTTKGELSFVLNGTNLGAAYEGIPLDKPLVPCVILENKGDSVELDTSGVKETELDRSIHVLSNIISKSITWDTITLTWDGVSKVSFYQIEVDGSKSWGATTTNTFTKGSFPPETEHNFRVRTVGGSSVSEWSGVVKGRTLKAPEFPECVWKTCPSYVDEKRKYSVNGKNPRVATKVNSNEYCAIIGNTHIPLNKATSWSIKILKSKDNDGDGIYIGIAPSDINQNDDFNYGKCGWYFRCYCSELFSGPPHSYRGKKYGPRKGSGEYVHTGDSVGVVVDTTKGKLSFVLSNVNHGIAYGGIPLDKPLVPCVLLKHESDSVELVASRVKENVESLISVPLNITAKSITWDSITLTWDEGADVSFYQIEVDGNKSWDASTTNTFTKRGLFPETEHSFRVRTVRGSSVSEWSSVVKGRTLKESFETSGWKECPDDVDDYYKYSVDRGNPRVVTKVNSNGCCTIIGNTSIPLNKVTSWSVKVLKSINSDGDGIYIGIAPNDINQNDVNYDKCGWYFYCYYSRLCSGPPHDYWNKAYGPRKESGEYVHTGDSVGVVVDTTKGELSFVLNNVNLGVAFEGIPLDKPLVPCVILNHKNDSVEFVI